ncbi:polynucleotide 3'-phosphatase [Myotisia sp. PD_48]|nr:polynucleotide 3'-phosphatase [Myotisia sp. PD_48]
MILSAFGAIFLSLIGLNAGVVASPTTYHTVEALNTIPEGWIQGRTASPNALLRLRLAVRQDKTQLFERTVLEISTPGHTRYGKHLSQSEVKEFLRPRNDVSEAILSWLRREGISTRSVENDGDWLHLKIPVSQAERILHTRFHQYHSLHDRSATVIRTLKYSVPRGISSYIHMIQPTTMFGVPPKQTASIAARDGPIPLDGGKVDCNKTITPKCLQDLYKIGDSRAGPDPRNVVGISGYLDQYARYSDFYKFIEHYAPQFKGANFSVQYINGGKNIQNSTRSSGEASLDTQYAIGLSNATTVYFTTGGRGPLVPDLEQPDEGSNSNEPYLDQLHYLRSLPNEKLPAVLTTSYGENEQSVPEKFSTAVCSLFAELGARGVSVIFSSGDSGVGGSCQTNGKKKVTRFNPIFPAVCPFVTSVGATYQINPEKAVDFSSGGFSDRHLQPPYQKEAVDGFLKQLGDKWKGLYDPRGRGFPDVSAQGSNYMVYDKGEVQGISGTSASAPAFAGIISNLNAIRLACGKPVLGYLNPFLYGTGKAGFTDIVHGGSQGCKGKDGGPIVPYGSWNATKGWDPVTGLGTPNFENLAEIPYIMSAEELQSLIRELHTCLDNRQLDHADVLLSRTKRCLLYLNVLIPSPSTPHQLLSFAREALELGALTSIRQTDAASFTRYYQQLQPFYDAERHIQTTVGPSAHINLSTSQRSKITGLYLLLLLSMGNNTEFHTVLEGLVVEASLKGNNVEDDPYIKYPVELERSLMEGSYDKVWRETKSERVPSEDFGLFSSILVGTIRSEIADCSEKAYPSLPISNAKNLLFLDSEGAVVEFAKERGWTLRDGRVYFPTQQEQDEQEAAQTPDKAVTLTSGTVIQNAIAYARQLETIV